MFASGCEKDGYGRGFAQRRSLNAHLARDHGLDTAVVLPFACYAKGCCKRYASRNELVAHFLQHTGERPFRCDYCGQGFRFRNSRDRHHANAHIVRRKDLGGVGANIPSGGGAGGVGSGGVGGNGFSNTGSLGTSGSRMKSEKARARARAVAAAGGWVVRCDICSVLCAGELGLRKHMRYKHAPAVIRSSAAAMEIADATRAKQDEAAREAATLMSSVGAVLPTNMPLLSSMIDAESDRKSPKGPNNCHGKPPYIRSPTAKERMVSQEHWISRLRKGRPSASSILFSSKSHCKGTIAVGAYAGLGSSAFSVGNTTVATTKRQKASLQTTAVALVGVRGDEGQSRPLAYPTSASWISSSTCLVVDKAQVETKTGSIKDCSAIERVSESNAKTGVKNNCRTLPASPTESKRKRAWNSGKKEFYYGGDTKSLSEPSAPWFLQHPEDFDAFIKKATIEASVGAFATRKTKTKGKAKRRRGKGKRRSTKKARIFDV